MKTNFKILVLLFSFLVVSNWAVAQTTIYVNAGETLRVKCWSETSPGVNESLDTDCQLNLSGTEDGEFADTIIATGPFYMELGNTDPQYLYYDWLYGSFDTHTVLVEMEGEWVGSKYHQGTGYEYVGFFWVRFEDPVYTATFTVTDAGTSSPISGATVTVTGEGSDVTDGSGNCTFSDLADGTYNYSVTATGYDAVNSSFTVSGSNVAVPVSMTETTAPTYTVNFTVNTSAKGITGATVTLTGYGDQVTDGSGNCSFTDIPDGIYAYSVAATGYQDASGSVTVSGSNVTETVSMDPLAIGDVNEIELNVYPNPCTEYVTIDGYYDLHWEVFNISGQLLSSGETERIEFAQYPSGMYILKIDTEDGIAIERVMKK